MSNEKIDKLCAISARSETTIIECIQIMREKKIGSILITDYNDRLIGIFTERDLLRRFDEIEKGRHWQKPIALVMTKPVETIKLKDLDRCSEILFEKNFRHLPVVDDSPEGPIIVGMISMRDLFRKMYMEHHFSKQKKDRQKALMFSKMGAVQSLIRKICAADTELLLDHVPDDSDLTSVLDGASQYQILFLDLDSVDLKTWCHVLKELNGKYPEQRIFLFYNVNKSSDIVIETLPKLSLSEQFNVYPKPLSIGKIISDLHTIPN